VGQRLPVHFLHGDDRLSDEGQSNDPTEYDDIYEAGKANPGTTVIGFEDDGNGDALAMIVLSIPVSVLASLFDAYSVEKEGNALPPEIRVDDDGDNRTGRMKVCLQCSQSYEISPYSFSSQFCCAQCADDFIQYAEEE